MYSTQHAFTARQINARLAREVERLDVDTCVTAQISLNKVVQTIGYMHEKRKTEPVWALALCLEPTEDVASAHGVSRVGRWLTRNSTCMFERKSDNKH